MSVSSAVTAGLLLVCFVAVGVAVVAVRDRWSRWWFELEDPRTIALLRIVLAGLLLINVVGLAPHFGLLFAADGMFTGEAAGQAFGGGWTERFSLLYLWDGPLAVRMVLGGFVVGAVCFLIGWHTRVAGVATLVFYDTILCRNPVFWEGTDLLLRVFLVYLVCSRCGHAYSVDEWLRRRRGSDGSLRLVPAWPRRLMMVQGAVLLATTGLLKHDDAWLTGDAVHYALTYEHFVRFRVEAGLAALGEGVLAALTWFARGAEVFFPLALAGVAGRWSTRRFSPLGGRRRGVVAVALAVFLISSTLVVAVTGAPRLLPVESAGVAAAAWAVVLGGTWWLLARRDERAARVVLGRRVWVTAIALLMLGMWLLMNIGVFHPAMLAVLLVFFEGHEIAGALGRVWRRLGSAKPGPTAEGLAYGSITRRVGGVLLGWHLVAIGVAVLPGTPVTAPLRDRVGLLAGPWLGVTRTVQSWGMWSRPPHANVFLKVVLVDADGDGWDLRTDLYAAELRPPGAIGYDRWWKIAERLVKGTSDRPYREAYGRYVCGAWDGSAAAVSVELREVAVPIPSPAENRAAHGYDPDRVLAEQATERLVYSNACP